MFSYVSQPSQDVDGAFRGRGLNKILRRGAAPMGLLHCSSHCWERQHKSQKARRAGRRSRPQPHFVDWVKELQEQLKAHELWATGATAAFLIRSPVFAADYPMAALDASAYPARKVT